MLKIYLGQMQKKVQNKAKDKQTDQELELIQRSKRILQELEMNSHTSKSQQAFAARIFSAESNKQQSQEAYGAIESMSFDLYGRQSDQEQEAHVGKK